MVIKADQEGIELLKRVQDALLRGHGTAAIPLYNALEQNTTELDKEDK